jgi:hypothetical protein
MQTMEPNIPKVAPVKTAAKVETVTLKQLAMTLAQSHGIPKSQVNAMLTGMIKETQAPKEGQAHQNRWPRHPAGAQTSRPYGPQPGYRRGHQDQGQQEDRLPRLKDLKEAV